jgi:hypothetical protein
MQMLEVTTPRESTAGFAALEMVVRMLRETPYGAPDSVSNRRVDVLAELLDEGDRAAVLVIMRAFHQALPEAAKKVTRTYMGNGVRVVRDNR